tara:strand:- start:2202 stop:3215 length:1014 start_codon:yes stop_codon:yes gene_type:complete
MEIKPNQLGKWTRESPPEVLSKAPACLIFGPDIGGVTDLSLALIQSEERVTLEGSDITRGAIASHTESFSLFGGGTTVLVRGATDKHVKEIQPILEAGINPGSKLIVQAGNLKGSSKLKKLFAGNKEAQSIVLYTMRGREITDFVSNIVQQAGLKIDRDATSMIGNEVSGDRAMAARTAESLILHAQGSDRSTVTREDVMAVCHGVDESDLSAPLDFALQGNLAAALSSLDDKLLRGENPIALMRIFTYRIGRFLALSQSGLAPSAAIAKARPPVFWTEKEMFSRILSRHNTIALTQILVMIDRAEDRMVETGSRPSLVLPDMLITISKGRLKWPKF